MSYKVDSFGADNDKTISNALLMKRLVSILDDVCGRLSDVQTVVSDYVETGTLTSPQMERLQSIDALTQEVESVRAVLERVTQATPSGEVCQYDTRAVLSDVRLSQIKKLLQHGTKADLTQKHGEFTLF